MFVPRLYQQVTARNIFFNFSDIFQSELIKLNTKVNVPIYWNFKIFISANENCSTFIGQGFRKVKKIIYNKQMDNRSFVYTRMIYVCNFHIIMSYK